MGVGKKLFHTDGLERSSEHREKVGRTLECAWVLLSTVTSVR